MKHLIPFCLAFAVLAGSCGEKRVSDLTTVKVIPRPVSIKATGDYFTIDKKTTVFYDDAGEAGKVALSLSEHLTKTTGLDHKCLPAGKVPSKGIYLTLTGDLPGNSEERYEIGITKKLLTLSAATPEGLFRGVQTIRQIIPLKGEDGTVELATGIITDSPDYSYRGMMLDVARHFFRPEDVKTIIDQVAFYKINFLHLHLSDDQGWRIEIKSWPLLTQHGGSTQVGGGKGGFYTQDEYREIVKYAADRFITVVPEIDMPGHTNAALASYAELNCNGRATELYTGTNVGFSSLCTKKDITYKFVDDVVREISEMTPGPYFHIGGDESHSTKKEDYIPFISRVQEIVVSHGKNVIGWDDIAISEIKPNTMAQFWANASNAKLAVSKGAKIIMSPAKKAYLDMQYNKDTKLGLHWAAYIEADSAYTWDPATYAEGISKENILGVEAPLWTETIETLDQAEYMVFPRLTAIAEIGWTPASLRNWDDYRERIAAHGRILESMGINFYKSELIPWK